MGLESYASDLNPVAVLINKAMIEIPPKFAGRKPIGPVPKGEETRQPARGLVRRQRVGRRRAPLRPLDAGGSAETYRPPASPGRGYSAEMAQERPDLKPLVGKKLTVIAWLWARTVKSPNPAYCACGCAACFYLHALHQGGERSLYRTGSRR